MWPMRAIWMFILVFCLRKRRSYPRIWFGSGMWPMGVKPSRFQSSIGRLTYLFPLKLSDYGPWGSKHDVAHAHTVKLACHPPHSSVQADSWWERWEKCEKLGLIMCKIQLRWYFLASPNLWVVMLQLRYYVNNGLRRAIMCDYHPAPSNVWHPPLSPPLSHFTLTLSLSLFLLLPSNVLPLFPCFFVYKEHLDRI